jgi:PAS domain S-box-containing protein
MAGKNRRSFGELIFEMSLGKTIGLPTGLQGGFALMESAPDATVIVGADGQIVFANAQVERFFQYAREELIGQPIEMLVPDRFRKQHIHHRGDYALEPRVRGMGVGLDLHGRRKDGTEFPVEISLSPIRVGSDLFVVSAIRDVTERKAVERELHEKNLALEEANSSKDRFLATMSHELRTPLNAIIGFTGTLLMKLPGPLTAEQEQQLKIVQSSARHLLSLINDILDLAKVESGKVELSFEPVSIPSVVAEVADSMRSFAHQKKLTLDLPAGKADLVVISDRRALRQIIINLVNNAIKYTERGGVLIDLEAHKTGGKSHATVTVTDTGIGIRKEDQNRLFQAFEQLDPSSTRRFEGAGLGLYLSHKLATLIGGSLSFESEYGSGSTFMLTIPIQR